MKWDNILLAFCVLAIVALLTLYGTHIFNEINKPEPVKIELTQEFVDQKVQHAVDSVLKAVSKTDSQIIDMYIEQEKLIGDLEERIGDLENQLKLQTY